MVSKASDDLPEPDRPVITIRLLRGRSRSMFLRLCSRAPRMEIFLSSLMNEGSRKVRHRSATCAAPGLRGVNYPIPVWLGKRGDAKKCQHLNVRIRLTVVSTSARTNKEQIRLS